MLTIRRCFSTAFIGLLLVSVFITACGGASPTATHQAMEPPSTAVPTSTAGPVHLSNPGFEEGDTGWTHSGNAEAVKFEEHGNSGKLRLTHQKTTAYQVETSQGVSGLANEWYTLRGWVRSSGGQKDVYLALQCGGEEKRVHVPPTTPGYRWLHLSV